MRVGSDRFWSDRGRLPDGHDDGRSHGEPHGSHHHRHGSSVHHQWDHHDARGDRHGSDDRHAERRRVRSGTTINNIDKTFAQFKVSYESLLQCCIWGWAAHMPPWHTCPPLNPRLTHAPPAPPQFFFAPSARKTLQIRCNQSY